MADPPKDFQGRMYWWVQASKALLFQEDQFLYLAVQNLMYAERMILDLERILSKNLENNTKDMTYSFQRMELSAHSILWIFGVYELLRLVRELKHPCAGILEPILLKVEILRMPLAKHSTKRIKGSEHHHYPTSFWSPETGGISWSVYNPWTKTMELVGRIEIANSLLAAIGNPT